MKDREFILEKSSRHAMSNSMTTSRKKGGRELLLSILFVMALIAGLAGFLYVLGMIALGRMPGIVLMAPIAFLALVAKAGWGR